MFQPFIILASGLLSSITCAHMIISSPSPIPGTNVKPPLDASGSDFPCHGVSLPSSGGQQMAAGSNQTLAFDLGGGANTAVHGGGSCQISVTYETDPAKLKDPNSWKVIYSIEGGCPSDTKGNLETAVACNGKNGPDCVNSFPFQIPKGIKNGHSIMAWTWVNTVGNREFYMDCVNAEFTGGDGSEMASFPNMFVANLANVDKCPTTESINVKFPDPGKYVTTMTAGNPYPLAVPTGQGCASAVRSDAAGGQTSAVASSTSLFPTQTPALAASASLSLYSNTTMPSSIVSEQSVMAQPTSMASPTASTVPSENTNAASSCPSGQVSCDFPGQVVCIDSTHFGICDTDHCCVPQSVAAGTTCSGGKITRRFERPFMV